MFGTHPFSENAQSRRAGPGPATQSIRRGRRRRRSWTAEPLEPRTLLSTFTVNSLGDTGAGTGLKGDLRYCITQADQTTGDNTINFSVTGTITLNSALPDLSNTTGLTDIEGLGPTSLTVARSSAAGTPDFSVFKIDADADAKLVGVMITGGNGDALHFHDGAGILSFGILAVTNSTIADNVSPPLTGGNGGGIANEGTMTLTDSTIDNNGASAGAGIANFGTMTVASSTITNNSSESGFHGAITNYATMSVTDSTITGNVGGGIASYFTMTVTNCTIANNANGEGGGIYVDSGTVTVSDSTIANNFGALAGGIENGGTMTVSNSTIAENSASGGDSGGIVSFSTLTVISCTIAFNKNDATTGWGGVDVVSGKTLLHNTIVALNTRFTGTGQAASDITGTVSGAYNLIGTGGSGGLVNGLNGNQVGVADPGLGTLADNGGPTQTIALLAGSPAIDMGSNALAVDPRGNPLTTDQRGPGFRRIVNNTVDVGAFEVQPAERLVVTVQPPSSVTASSGFGLTVTAEDSSGTVDTSFSGTVTMVLSNNPGGATLGGTLSVMAQSGVATFSDLTLNKAGTGYTLLVSGEGVASATTDPFDVTAATATQLVLTTQPSSGVPVGSAFGLVVSAEDAFHNVEPNFAGSVTLALMNNPGGATLGGTLTVPAQSGVATFSDLTLDQPGIGYTLQVTSSGLTSTTAGPFNVQTTIATVAANWGTQTAPLQTAADGLRLLPAGRNTDLPWLGIEHVQITLGQAATLTPADVTVTGIAVANYGPVTISGSGTSYTITLAQAINKADRVTITIASATIATFTRRLDVLPGDFNDDGVVNSQDLVGVRNEWLKVNGATATIFGDLNGDGVVNINDYNIVRAASGTTLPAITAPATTPAATRLVTTTTVGESSGGNGIAPVVPATAVSTLSPESDSNPPVNMVSLAPLVTSPSVSINTAPRPAQTVTISVSVHVSKAARRAAAAASERAMKRAEIRLANRGRRLSMEIRRALGRENGTDRNGPLKA